MGPAFLLAGLIPVSMAGYCVLQWKHAQTWGEARAVVLAVDLKTTTGNGGGSGRSSSTRVAAEYEYSWNGSTYRSHEISPFLWIQPFDSVKREVADSLRRAKARQQEIVCFVNPDCPEEAYVKRDFHAGAVTVVTAIGILFSSVGVIFLRQEWRRRVNA